MRQAGMAEAPIRAFRSSYEKLVGGDPGTIPEAAIQPVTDLPSLSAIGNTVAADARLLAQTAVLKLNGGLGTSMGLAGPKSLLPVKNQLSFLDFIVRHLLSLGQDHGVQVRLILMNSFNTSVATQNHLRQYPELGSPESLELLQSQVPKVDATTLAPACWPENPQLEWCPPGHGDIYPSLLGSGLLDRLLQAGIVHLFVANADNLGASLDLALLTYFARSGMPFLMEVAERTASDRKGGHLARRDGRFVLRESAQCPEDDLPQFQDILRHRFFNTNNLWIRLDRLRELLVRCDGVVPLPLIRNAKRIDPRNKTSPQVYQLETAMGAAIEAFEGAGAIVVPRSRFAPVKTTADLLALRSDAYQVTDDWRVVLDPVRARPPLIDLDPEHFGIVDQLDASLAAGVPSLRHCDHLIVRGPVAFSPGTRFEGKVELVAPAGQTATLPPGTYADRVVAL